MEIVHKHKEALKLKIQETWFQEKYKFYNTANYFGEIDIKSTTWDDMGWVILDSSGEIEGYIGYSVSRLTNSVKALWAINFNAKEVTFGLFLREVIFDIFNKFNFNKLNFRVTVGNPVEKSYDKIIKLMGGYIAGYYKEDCILYDGKLYDQKEYELMRKDFVNFYNRT